MAFYCQNFKPKYMFTEEFVLPKMTSELFDLASDLWIAYFKPAEPLTASERKEIMKRYNLCANEANKRTGHAHLQIITPSTRWIPKGDVKELPIKNHKPIVEEKAQETNTFANTNTQPVQRGNGIVQQIISLHIEGKSNKEIIALGFNKSTVGRQVSEYKKRLENANKQATYAC